MKLGIISSMAASPWGGSEELWVALASQALSEGHTVAASVYNWGELPVKIKEIEKKGVVIHKRSRISYLDIKGKFKGKIAQLFVAEKQLLRFTSI